jgi:putative transposase
MEYRRAFVPGGTFFLTLVTNGRARFLATGTGRRCLRRAFRDVRRRHPFSIEAIVLLDDHLHMLMRLPAGDADFSIRVGGIKGRFSRLYIDQGGAEPPVSDARRRKRYRGLWQARFWEHTIRDARDFKLHLDYIHANPLRHGVVNCVRNWPWSSFHRYLKLGEYEADWAGHVTLPHEVEYYYAD